MQFAPNHTVNSTLLQDGPMPACQHWTHVLITLELASYNKIKMCTFINILHSKQTKEKAA